MAASAVENGSSLKKHVFGFRTLDQAFTGTTAGFDYLRLLLAIAVICWHSIVTSYGMAFERTILDSPWRGLVWFILPSFFALSGFLVSGSLARSKSLVVFGSLRALRIFPALTVDVLFWTLLVGPLITDFALDRYFTERTFYSYLTNIVGWVHYRLPGVFLDNPIPELVNPQLWTVPYELECYILLGFTAAFGLLKRRYLIFLPIAGLCIMHFIGSVNGIEEGSPTGFPPGRFLVVCFLVGVAFYFYREYVRLNIFVFVASIVASYVLLQNIAVFYLASIPVTYVTVYLGVLSIRKLPFIFYGDYSYGLYLYGFGMQQLTSWMFPDFRHWWFNIAVALFLSALMAVASWHLIEKPILDRKRRLIERLQEAIDYFSGQIMRRRKAPDSVAD